MQLCEARQRKGMTHMQLAITLGVTASAVSNWEQGLRVPRLPTLRRLAVVLGVPIEEIEFPAEAEPDTNEPTAITSGIACP